MKNKKVMALVGALAIVVVGVSVFVFAPKDSGSAEVAQEVVEAVATPTIEIPEETSEEVSEPEEAEEVPEVEVAEEPEEPVETSEEVSEVEESIVEVAETSPEVSEDAGVSTQTEEVKPVEPKQEEVKPAETKPVETQPVQTKPVQTQPSGAQEEARKQAMALLAANGGATSAVNGEAGHFVNTDGWTSGGVME